MNKSAIVTALVALGLAGNSLLATAASTSQPLAPQASIAFANRASSIRDWQADDIQGIWVQDGFKQWYYAKLMGPCLGLDFAIRVGFQTRAMDTLDRFSTIIVPGHGSCPIQSFTKSQGPEGRERSGASEVES